MDAKAENTAIGTNRKRAEDIGILMGRLAKELKRHGKEAKRHPRDWGYAGSVGHVRDLLVEAVAFLGNVDIETLQQELRERQG